MKRILFPILMLSMGVYIGLSGAHFAGSSPFPFPVPDRGGCIVTVPDDHALAAVTTAFASINMRPPKGMNTVAADRRVWVNESTVDMIDVVKPGMDARLAGIRGSYQRTVSNPIHVANVFAATLLRFRYTAEVIENPDPEICKGSLAVVKSSAFPGISFSFRKNVFSMCIQPK